jgi:hypothetical protein
LFGVDERQPTPIEGQSVVRREKVVLEIPVLRDPKAAADAFDSRAQRIVDAEHFARLEMELDCVEGDVHGRSFIMRLPHAESVPAVAIVIERLVGLKRSLLIGCMKKANA